MNGRYSRAVQNTLLIVGLLLITIFVAAHIHRAVLSRSAVESFNRAKDAPRVGDTRSLWDRPVKLDSSLWSRQRLAAYEESLAANFAQPLAILRIRQIHLEVPVLVGTDDLTLNRGVGLIAGTSTPGEEGRIGIAGHRDGFFRGLKDIGPGAVIELETLDRIYTYRVDEIVIVKPEDVSVLRPTSKPTLTLVTCYPFYFMGSAPQRYIVSASLVESGHVPDDVKHPQNVSTVGPQATGTNEAAQSQELVKETTP